MKTYTYLAVNPEGRNLSGTVVAESEQHAEEKLSTEGLVIITLEEMGEDTAKRRGFGAPFGFVRLREIAWAFSRLASMLRSGVGLVEALDTLVDVQRGKLRGVLADVAERIRSGSSFSEALGEHTDVFGMSDRVVRVAELSGELPRRGFWGLTERSCP